MRKNFRMYLTLALVMLGVMSVSAQERIPVDAEHFTFHNYNGWDANATVTGVATGENGNFLLDQADGCPIGDTNCNAWIDLGAYSKMYVKMAGCDENGELNGSNPRIFINRTADNGQFNADKSAAQCLVIPNAGTWAEEYYTVEDDGTYVIDLTKIGKEWGFVHFHSIKGSAWNTKAIVYSIEVEKAAAGQQIGWTNLINNSDMEGDDVSSFFTKIDRGQPLPSEITDGVGVDGSRGIKVAATAKEADNWDNQFWFYFNEPVPAGSKYRVSFDYRADIAADAETQAHANPSNYIHHEMFGNISFDENWKTFTKEGEVSAAQAEGKNDDGTPKYFQSVAFNLNAFEGANNYYFDNIKFEVYKYGTTAEFNANIIKLDFGFDTNIADLVKACGMRRLLYPTEYASVTIDGKPAKVSSIEGSADGDLYIFLDMSQPALPAAKVLVSFNNPAEEEYHIIYTSGPGGDVANIVDVEASYNFYLGSNGEMPFEYMVPVVLKADPESGSFNLPNSIKDFKLTFDKDVNTAELKATINGKAMTVTPNTGAATDVTLTREGTDDLPSGEYTINVTNIQPMAYLGFVGDTTIVVNIGAVVDDPNDQPYDVIPMEYFTNCAADGVPEGFLLVADNEEKRTAGGNYGSGARMMKFSEGGDFIMGLYMRTYYVEYGTPEEDKEDHYLDLEAGKKYVVTFNSCRWAEAGRYLKFSVLDTDGNEILKKVVENNPNVAEKKDAVSGTTYTEVTFIPETTGRYIMRWTVAKDSEGTDTNNDWMNGVILANVRVRYMPNIPGIEYVQLLNTALDNAKSTLSANANERYDGKAFSDLDEAIKEYEAAKGGYTAPSDYQNAAAALDAAAQALKDHRVLCDDYDTQIKKALDVERQNKENKFAKTELYAQVQAVVAKYHGSSEWVNESEDPEVEDMKLYYTYDVLKEDAALAVAVAELSDVANTASLLFTVGKSTPEGSNNGKGTGVAVFTERLRLGAEALMALGVAEDDELIVAVNDALTDDDALAEAIQTRIKTIVYGNLKDPNNEMFKPVPDENTLEDVNPQYDMTVFVKNPNIYKQLPNTSFTDENVPGWITPEGYNRPGLTIGWGAAKNVEGVAEDCMFQTWGSSYRVEQTITDLPAGIYAIEMGFGERQGEAQLPDSYIFAKTTDMDEEITTDAVVIGQSFPFLNLSIGFAESQKNKIVVTDGILTIGVNAGASSSTFFNDVRLWMTGAAAVDYASLYQEVVDGIKPTETSAQVRALQLYDLNGSRITTARKGIVIVKKIMSDGSVRTEKVIKK